MKRRMLIIGLTMNIGGVETYIMNLISALDKKKFDFYVPSLGGNVAYKDELCQMGVQLIDAPISRNNFFRYIINWYCLFKHYQFDIIYYNTCDIVAIDVLKFAKAAGVPIRIIHSHSTGNQQGIEQKMSLFHQLSEKHSRKILSQYATHLFACSETAGDWMFDGRDYQVIKNGIQLSKYRFNQKNRKKIRGEYGYKKEILVGIIGRLSPPKNPFFVISVLKELLDTPDIKAVFVGDGEQRAEVQKAVDKAALNEQIQFVGAVDNVHEWMSAIDCLLMPSLFEGLPFTLVEAQAAGLPCIVSSSVSEEANLTGLVEYVSLKESTEVWAEKIMAVCRRERPDTTQQLIDAGYSIEATAKTVSEIIKESLRKA